MAEFLPLILVLPVLLALSAIASGSETALFRLSHRERADLRRTAPGVSAAVEALLAEPRRLLLFVLMLNMVVNVAYFVVSSVLTTRAPTPALAAGIGTGSVLAIVLFGEILPKAVAGAGRRRFCMVLARPLAVAQVLLDPVVSLVDHLALSPIIRLLGPGRAGLDRAGSGRLEAADLARLVETGERAGVLTESERRLLAEVIELGEIRVREAMRPIDRVRTLPVTASRESIVAEAASTRRTAILLCTPTLDAGVAGFLHVKRYLAATHGRVGVHDASPFVESALFVPDQARLDAVLEVMRGRGTTHALCVDEHGRVVGMIEADDIVDELLGGTGEARGADRDSVLLVGLGRWRVSGDLAARDWLGAFGLAADLATAATVGGMVTDRLGRLARVGDRVEIGPARLTVEALHGRRIRSLLVEMPGDAAPEAAP